ncbi:MAG TPA: hypothetical protein VGF46_11570 [Gaiellales bacterium]
MTRTLLQRVHNPRGRTCGCASDCWCQRSAVGRALRWWVPGRYVGLHHKRAGDADWKRSQAG